MAVSTTINFVSVADLLLDPKNPRLGREAVQRGLSQPEVFEIMKTWSLEELGQSMCMYGFWPQEALLVVRDPSVDTEKWTVVEGNRRLATIKALLSYFDGAAKPSRALEEAVQECQPTIRNGLRLLPCIEADSREDVDAFLGFRHVTGIKEWHPAEKAEFISHLVLNRGMAYKEVAKTIGSKARIVGRNFVTFQVLRQLEDEGYEEEAKEVEERFSVLFLSFRNKHIREFVRLDLELPPEQAKNPIPDEKLEELADVVGWLFGTTRRPKIVRESRQTDRFALTLANDKAVQYLRSATKPSLDVAYRIAGGESADVVESLTTAAFEVEQALSVLQHHVDEPDVKMAAKRLVVDVQQVLANLPSLRPLICGSDADSPS